ncbi:hypothetical protein [Streptomyces colonosanans]|uniref:hypothetical protein n=1 Tax=Streptomyces colonosanans TaxID=1428652 RepID=UPI0009A0B28B|nr:hypothetical protein [Streptomyces colonosanans]
MHRTTTTATLLVTISALSGCVTVDRPTTPGPPPAHSHPSTPHPDGSAKTHAVQAPAREALELVRPSPDPSPSAAGPRRTTGPTPTAVPTAPPHDRSAAPHPKPTPPRPHVGEPPTIRDGFPRNTDMCMLGRRYGKWQPNSPEAAFCQGIYGR